jgi:putative oxidoreductase
MKPLIDTNTRAMSLGILLLRLMAGLILFIAGAGKVMGWFGGFGMKTSLQMFEDGLHLSAFWTYMSCYTEFIGGFLLMAGFLTRPAAVFLFINMAVATWSVGPKNFFMGGGAYPCLLLVISAVILLTGPMLYSVDALLSSKKNLKSNLTPAF